MALVARPARLVEFRELVPEVRHFVFEVEGSAPLQYTPGQFISFSADIGGKTVTRAYSVAGLVSGSRFELCLNRVQDGILSPYLFELSPGAVVSMKGPIGGFVPRSPPADSLFVATGTGIAPMRPMLFDLTSRDAEHSFTLLFGARYRDGLYYREEFEQMERERPNFRFHPTLTRPDENWRGRTGRIQGHLFETIGTRRDIDVYVCGLKEMVNDVRARLTEAGFERRRILYERYD